MRPTADERFWAKVDRDSSGCWLWTSATHRGYGAFWLSNTQRAVIAHRFAYELLIGPIPEGLTLDHLCQTKLCVNPLHMDPCTAGENARRSPLAPYNVRAAQTHCKRGHLFDEKNTAIRSGRRSCRACAAAHSRGRSGEAARLRVELRELRAASLRHAADLVRLGGEPGCREEHLSRDAVVEIALRLKGAVDAVQVAP